MKSFSDDLPNVTKEEVQRATTTAQQAVDVSKATLATAEENLARTKRTEKYTVLTHYLLWVTLIATVANIAIQLLN